MEFIGKVVTRSAGPGSESIAALNHEAVDHPVKRDAVVIGIGAPLPGRRIPPFLGALGESDEVGDGVGNFLVEQPHGKRALAGVEYRVSTCLHVCSSRTAILLVTSCQFPLRLDVLDTGNW